MIVMKEVAGGRASVLLLGRLQRGSVDEEDVGPAVAVVVDDGDSGAGGLDDVALGVDAAVDIADGDSCLGGNVDEPGGGCGRW